MPTTISHEAQLFIASTAHCLRHDLEATRHGHELREPTKAVEEHEMTGSLRDCLSKRGAGSKHSSRSRARSRIMLSNNSSLSAHRFAPLAPERGAWLAARQSRFDTVMCRVCFGQIPAAVFSAHVVDCLAKHTAHRQRRQLEKDQFDKPWRALNSSRYQKYRSHEAPPAPPRPPLSKRTRTQLRSVQNLSRARGTLEVELDLSSSLRNTGVRAGSTSSGTRRKQQPRKRAFDEFVGDDEDETQTQTGAQRSEVPFSRWLHEQREQSRVDKFAQSLRDGTRSPPFAGEGGERVFGRQQQSLANLVNSSCVSLWQSHRVLAQLQACPTNTRCCGFYQTTATATATATTTTQHQHGAQTQPIKMEHEQRPAASHAHAFCCSCALTTLEITGLSLRQRRSKACATHAGSWKKAKHAHVVRTLKQQMVELQRVRLALSTIQTRRKERREADAAAAERLAQDAEAYFASLANPFLPLLSPAQPHQPGNGGMLISIKSHSFASFFLFIFSTLFEIFKLGVTV